MKILLANYRHFVSGGPERYMFNVIVTFLSPATLYGLTAARLARVPVRIATERGTAYEVPRWSHRLYMLLETLALNDATLVVANSEPGRRFVLSRGIVPSKTRVIYNGLEPLPAPTLTVEQMRACLGVMLGDPIIGTIASLTAKKDHATLLRAARQVLEYMPSACFVLVGEGPLRSQIERLAVKLGISEHIHLVGQRTNRANWLQVFDLVVLSSAEREGCSNVLMEAQYIGKPVVATHIGGNADVVQHGQTGLLVPPTDPARLTQAILFILRNPTRAKEMGEYGIKYVTSKFTLEKYISLWQSTIRSMVGC